MGSYWFSTVDFECILSLCIQSQYKRINTSVQEVHNNTYIVYHSMALLSGVCSASLVLKHCVLETKLKFSHQSIFYFSQNSYVNSREFSYNNIHFVTNIQIYTGVAKCICEYFLVDDEGRR